MSAVVSAVEVHEALGMLANLELLPDAQRRLAAETAVKLATDVLYVAVIGEFKRGKTTLINALLDAAALPTGVTPVTAVSTLLRFGAACSAVVLGNDGAETAIDVADLGDYVTEQGNPDNRRGVREVVVTHPAPLLRSGLTIVDTPGMGSVHAHNTEMAEAFLPRVDVALLVLSVDAPLSDAEAALLARVRASAARVAICLNKADLLSPLQVDEVVSFVTRRLESEGEHDVIPVFVVSARHACEGRPGSGMAELRDWLEDTVGGRRQALINERGGRVAAALLSAAEAAVRVEEAVAAHSAAALASASRAFEGAQRELAAEAAEARSLLLTAGAEDAANVIDTRSQHLRAGLPSLLLGRDDGWEDELRSAAARWVHETEADLVQTLGPRLQRHVSRLQDQADRFISRAGAAFGVTLPIEGAIEPLLTLPPVRVEISDAPGALAMGVRRLREGLPGGAGRRWRAGARRRRAVEDADRLAGRLHHAASEAVAVATREWAEEVEARWRLLSDAIAAAVDRGRRTAEGEHVDSTRLDSLGVRLDRIRQMVGDA